LLISGIICTFAMTAKAADCDDLKLKCAGKITPFTKEKFPNANLNNSACTALFHGSRSIQMNTYYKWVEAGDAGVVRVGGSSNEYYFGQQRPDTRYQKVTFPYQLGVPFKIDNPTYGDMDQIECVIFK